MIQLRLNKQTNRKISELNQKKKSNDRQFSFNLLFFSFKLKLQAKEEEENQVVLVVPSKANNLSRNSGQKQTKSGFCMSFVTFFESTVDWTGGWRQFSRPTKKAKQEKEEEEEARVKKN